MELIVCKDDLIEKVIGAAIEVHRELGPGLLESVYEQAMMWELANQGIVAFTRLEAELSVRYALGLALFK